MFSSFLLTSPILLLALRVCDTFLLVAQGVATPFLLVAQGIATHLTSNILYIYYILILTFGQKINVQIIWIFETFFYSIPSVLFFVVLNRHSNPLV